MISGNSNVNAMQIRQSRGVAKAPLTLRNFLPRKFRSIAALSPAIAAKDV
jgi:hypothetical protein